MSRRGPELRQIPRWQWFAVAAVIAAGGAVYRNWRGDPFTAVPVAINGVTFALLALAFMLAGQGRRP